MKRYVSYDEDTFEFVGFYNDELHSVIPKPCKEIEVTGHVQRKGKNTHYNPDTDVFYTPDDVLVAKEEADNRDWRDGQLRQTDKYMVSDWPISPVDKQAVIQYRQELRDYPETWIRPELSAFVG